MANVIVPKTSIGKFKLGASQKEARQASGEKDPLFTPRETVEGVDYPASDIFQQIHTKIDYDTDDKVECIEVTSSAVLNGKDLFKLTYDDAVQHVKASDANIELSNTGFVSRALGLVAVSYEGPGKRKIEVVSLCTDAALEKKVSESPDDVDDEFDDEDDEEDDGDVYEDEDDGSDEPPRKGKRARDEDDDE